MIGTETARLHLPSAIDAATDRTRGFIRCLDPKSSYCGGGGCCTVQEATNSMRLKSHYWINIAG